MKPYFKNLTTACLAILLSAATLNAQTTGTSSAGASATDQQSPDRNPTTSSTSNSATTTSTTSNAPDNSPGAAATDTSTNAAPTASSTTTTSSSKTSTSSSGKTIYLGTKYTKTPGSLTAHANGKVYDDNGKLVGHVTDMDGKSLKSVPASGDYQIQTRMGKVIGSTQPGSGVDSNRTVQLTTP